MMKLQKTSHITQYGAKYVKYICVSAHDILRKSCYCIFAEVFCVASLIGRLNTVSQEREEKVMLPHFKILVTM